MDAAWLQNSLLTESEISLVWTLLQVFRCRYRPAQLGVIHMTRQLEDAEVQSIPSSQWFLQTFKASHERCKDHTKYANLCIVVASSFL